MSTISGSPAQFAPKAPTLSAAPPLSPQSGGTSAGEKVGPSSTTDRAQVDPEAILEQKTAQFGSSLKGLSDQQKGDVGKIHDAIEKKYENKDYKGPGAGVEFTLGVMQYANQGLAKNPKDTGLNTTFEAGRQWLDAYTQSGKSLTSQE